MIRHINHYNDFKDLVVIPASLAEAKFNFTYFVGRNRYVAEYDGTTYTHCERIDATHILVNFDRHGLPQGRLCVDYNFQLVDSTYPDGYQRVHTREMLDIMLTDGRTDEAVNAEVQSNIFIEMLRGYSAYELAVREQGFVGSVDDWLVSLAPVVGENGNWWVGDRDLGVQADFTEAETARVNAELAREDAEAARVLAEQARAAAEAIRVTDETSRIAAETARAAAETARSSAEQARAAAETARATAEATRNSAEIARNASEQQRANNEAVRGTSETQRVSAEATRQQNEQARQSGESGRASQEEARESAEATRKANENARIAAEQQREQGEAARNTAYATAEASRNTQYEAAENARDASFAQQLAEQDATFESKEATRDAANQAALNCADALAALGPEIDRLEERIDGIEARVETMEELFGESVEGYVRVADTSDPEMTFREYKHTKVGEESVFDCYKPCLVGNNFTGEGTCGKILHILDPLDWYKDENGNTRKLDGSEGEVLICNTKTIYAINGHVSVNGVEYDVFLRSYIPFEWNGHKAEEVKPTGISPHYCVSHNDEDNVTRMHSVLNMEWAGSWQAQVDCVGKFVATDDGEGNIVETYDEDAAIIGDAMGKSSTNISLPDGEQRAMNINDDTTKTIPYYNIHAHAVELHHVGLMLAEGGNWYLHAGARMGSGFSANAQATSAERWDESDTTASNGFRYIKHDGTTWGYYGFNSNANFGLGTTGDNLYKGCMLNQWRTPWNIFEQQRVLMYAKAHNIAELTWFAFEGSIYKYRSVSGFAGLADGVMTAVVWKKLASKLPQGAVEPTTTNDVGGNRCEWLISSAVYRGVITDVSPSWWTSGLWMCQWYTDNHYEAWLCKDQAKMLKSSSSTAIDESAEYPQEAKDSGYLKLAPISAGNAYRKNFGESMFWPKNEAGRTGGGLGTYVGGYSYLNGTRPAEGKKISRGFRRGIYAAYTCLSPMCVYGYSAPSGTYSVMAFGICCQIVVES